MVSMFSLSATLAYLPLTSNTAGQPFRSSAAKSILMENESLRYESMLAVASSLPMCSLSSPLS